MAISEVTQRDTQLEKQRAGFMALTLTNFDTDLEPAIAAGSVVELSGSLYSITTAESISGSATAGANYIYFDAAGTGFTYSSVAPTWSDAKQGWYNVGNDRAVAGFTFSSPDYTDKYLYDNLTQRNNTFTGDNTFSGDNKINATQITGLTYGDVGTYVIAASTSWSVSTQYLPGTTVAGNTLIRSQSVVGNGSSFNASGVTGNFETLITSDSYITLSLTGTWTLMTRVYRSSSSTIWPLGLFLRTA